jgi:hypothetical protein
MCWSFLYLLPASLWCDTATCLVGRARYRGIGTVCQASMALMHTLRCNNAHVCTCTRTCTRKRTSSNLAPQHEACAWFGIENFQPDAWLTEMQMHTQTHAYPPPNTHAFFTGYRPHRRVRHVFEEDIWRGVRVNMLIAICLHAPHYFALWSSIGHFHSLCWLPRLQ